jgi:glycosyltransferase involved in cell wall biosynthesis
LHVTSPEEARIAAAIAGEAAVARIPFGVVLPEAPSPAGAAGKRLLFLGRLHRVKNLGTLIRAFVEAAPEGWELRLAGPDEDSHRATLESLVADLGAGGRVSFAGPVYGTEKARELADARALVLPSFTENFGAVVAEALAMGRPVIASRGTPWQVLGEAGCGWWVAPDQAGLAGAIADLARTSPATLSRMGALGRDLAARDYSWDRVATQMARLYAGLALEPSPGAARKQS